MLAFDLRRVDFADGVVSGGEVASLNPGGIRVTGDTAKGLEEGRQLRKDTSGSGPSAISPDSPCERLKGMP
ncbi:MAG TPA: hypothetical protein VKK81_10055 [Candidatus Binatia bacterium]|nr:hypothetical protein [Candidatus Binatia bacterium]